MLVQAECTECGHVFLGRFPPHPTAGLEGLSNAVPLLIKIFLVELPILGLAHFNWEEFT